MHIPHNRVHLDKAVLGKDRARADFLRDINHELRTPLNVIIGLCQYLDRNSAAPLTATQKETVDRMQRNANALLHSVNRLLESLRTGDYK